jgi:hypothetical protein
MEASMRFNRIIRALALAVGVSAAACGGDDKAAENAALQNDLSLAAQQQTRLDSVSALEAGATATAPASNVRAPSTVRRSTTSSAPRRTTRTASSSSSGSTGSASSGGTVTSSSGGEVVVQKNTKRDAAIGAAAGAVIGATTSRDKVKGAVIGGVVGGVLGGVIGNNVDVKKTKKPPV